MTRSIFTLAAVLLAATLSNSSFAGMKQDGTFIGENPLNGSLVTLDFSNHSSEPTLVINGERLENVKTSLESWGAVEQAFNITASDEVGSPFAGKLVYSAGILEVERMVLVLKSGVNVILFKK